MGTAVPGQFCTPAAARTTGICMLRMEKLNAVFIACFLLSQDEGHVRGSSNSTVCAGCVALATVLLWPLCCFGHCVALATVLLWPLCCFGHCVALATVLLWPLCWLCCFGHCQHMVGTWLQHGCRTWIGTCNDLGTAAGLNYVVGHTWCYQCPL
jgi:hypothetical protein